MKMKGQVSLTGLKGLEKEERVMECIWRENSDKDYLREDEYRGDVANDTGMIKDKVK